MAYTHTRVHVAKTAQKKTQVGGCLPLNAFFHNRFRDDYLGPRLEKDHPSLLLFVFDHNRDHLVA